MGEQKDLFFKMWVSDKEKVCELCGDYLGHVALAHFFSHILGKGAYPKFRVKEDNIMYNCFDCHHKWDAGDPQKLKYYQEIKERKENLIREYYGA